MSAIQEKIENKFKEAIEIEIRKNTAILKAYGVINIECVREKNNYYNEEKYEYIRSQF